MNDSIKRAVIRAYNEGMRITDIRQLFKVELNDIIQLMYKVKVSDRRIACQ